MIDTRHNSRKLIGRGALIATGMLTGGLSATLFVLVAAATGI
ncbi:MAG: hypothetical protein O3B37_06290 [Proteobacteria bacterium]|nr:hypothetical protein [Pseudomonadota bacterium]